MPTLVFKVEQVIDRIVPEKSPQTAAIAASTIGSWGKPWKSFSTLEVGKRHSARGTVNSGHASLRAAPRS